MENIVGIFHSIDAAEQAYDDLIGRAIPEQALILLSREAPSRSGRSPVTPEEELDKVRTTDAKPLGKGKDMGAVIGATTGGTAGFTVGVTVATLMVPGLGLISAIGIGAAALLGLGGGVAGAKIGDTVERSSNPGVPKEQVTFYHQLLQRGYSLVIANVRSGAEISSVREVFQQRGSEDSEAVRSRLGDAA